MESQFLIHPGKVLKNDFLDPISMTAYALAKAIHVPPPRIYEIVACRRSITADTAIRLAKYYGTTAKFWLNIQVRFDIEKETIKNVVELNQIEP